ncbi:MAG: V-type ATP synthase subunit B [Candidatus Bathyarchaeia archaeon]|jgi:V/A-type H+-transporting ATPase subunit B
MLGKTYGLIHKGLSEIKGSLVMVDNVENVGYDELVKVRAPDGIDRMGRVMEVGRGKAVIQVFGGVMGLESNSILSFSGSAFKIPLSNELLGRVFNGVFEPVDRLPAIVSDESRDINGAPINPKARVYPNNFIQTGISAIDGMLSLVRGQKLPIFSESGLPHNKLIAQISRQATVLGEKEEFALVFAAMGLRHDEAEYFIDEFRTSGALERSVVVLNLADDPAIERLFTPRIALTVAEYMAYDLGMHVLVILSDMTNYAEVLRELSAAREEVPSRKGYPGYLYSDLASIYERAGVIEGSRGSLTQMPILTMPGGDLQHPIPDLTGYITEGQIFLDRELFMRGIYPPINVLPCLSRLMRKGIGKGKTREDHGDVADQLYGAYARGRQARDLARIVGNVGLSEEERLYLKFADDFESRLVRQGEFENRSIEQSLGIAWSLLGILPEDALTRIHEEYIQKYHPKHVANKEQAPKPQ